MSHCVTALRTRPEERHEQLQRAVGDAESDDAAEHAEGKALDEQLARALVNTGILANLRRTWWRRRGRDG
jgi:hypothetical protein